MCVYIFGSKGRRVYTFLMRDEKEGRRKQARSNKQTRQSNTAHPRQSLFPKKNELHIQYIYEMCLVMYIVYMYILSCVHARTHIHTYTLSGHSVGSRSVRGPSQCAQCCTARHPHLWSWHGYTVSARLSFTFLDFFSVYNYCVYSYVYVYSLSPSALS